MIAVIAQSSTGVQGAIAGAAGVPVAFVVGMVSFFTPCILPLLPGYLSYVSGVSGEDLETGARRSRVFLGTALFVLGFALIFTALGATTSAIGGFLFDHFSLIERLSGVFVIVMGVAFLLTVSTKQLMTASASGGALAPVARSGLAVARVISTERGVGTKASPGVVGALPLGAAFAVTWTPCVGPGLGTVLAIAGSEGSAARGAILLFSFSLGFGFWFIVGALAFRRATRAVSAIRRHITALTLAGGLLLVTIGILLVTDVWNSLLAPIRRWLQFTAPL